MKKIYFLTKILTIYLLLTINILGAKSNYFDKGKILFDKKEFENNKVLNDTFKYAEENNNAVHFLGLVSSGGVHSHQEHLFELIKLSEKYNFKSYIHAFTDGRDVDPKSGYNDNNKLEKFLVDKNTFLAFSSLYLSLISNLISLIP